MNEAKMLPLGNPASFVWTENKIYGGILMIVGFLLFVVGVFLFVKAAKEYYQENIKSIEFN